MIARVACLAIFGLWALYGVYLHLTGGFGEEGGGRFALIGLAALGVFLVACLVIERVTDRHRESPPGFPVEPPGPRWRR